MRGGEQRNSGARRSGVSTKEEGGRGTRKGKGSKKGIKKGSKKRGVKGSATRANAFWEAGDQVLEAKRAAETSDQIKNNNKLSYEETIGIMGK